MRGFAALLGDFLLDYVPRRRGLSENTAASYRDSFVLLLGWLDSECGVSPDDVEIADLRRDRIESFCLWLVDSRGCGAATVNVRISAIRAFASYVSFAEPAHLEWARSVRSVEFSKSPSRTVDYLSPEAAGAIVDEARSSARDLAKLSLLYDVGARVSEICDARREDLRTQRPTTMRLVGKGRKARVVPICDEVAKICEDYLGRSGVGPDGLLFPNRLGNRMGRAGVAWVLSKHAAAAHGKRPKLVPEKVHPHMLRYPNRDKIQTPDDRTARDLGRRPVGSLDFVSTLHSTSLPNNRTGRWFDWASTGCCQERMSSSSTCETTDTPKTT